MRLLAEFLIALGIAVLLGAVGYVVVRRIKDGIEKDERDPEQPRNVDRGHARSEAEAAKDTQLSDAEAAQVAEFEAFVEEIRTGELQLVPGSVWAFEADPLGAPIPDDHAREAPRLFGDVTAQWLSTFTWLSDPAPSVPLSSVQVPDVEPLELEGPTGVFPKDWLEKAMAGGAR